MGILSFIDKNLSKTCYIIFEIHPRGGHFDPKTNAIFKTYKFKKSTTNKENTYNVV